MSCYHPLVGIPTGSLTENGKQVLKIKSVKSLGISYEEIVKKGYVLIPCSHCIGCRLDYSRRWADRMMLELEEMKKGIFITLTYDNEHCPWTQFDNNDMPLYATVSKRDCQLFMKSLRKEFDKKGIKLRFFLSSEYGPKTLRPHYHAIIFGIGLSDIDDRIEFGRNNLNQAYYISQKIEKIWSRGHIYISDVSYETCAYVARYVMKKQYGEKSLDYARRNVLPEFTLMSRKPGIGRAYLDRDPSCLDNVNINLSTLKKGLQIQIPKYFVKVLNNPGTESCPNPLYNPEKYAILIEQRRKLASDNTLSELLGTDLTFTEYLEKKENKKKEQIKVIRRKELK